VEGNSWLKARIAAYLFLMGLKRRTTLGARLVLIDDEERVYLIRHTYAPGWHFPGGGVEPGESSEAAAGRELGEESGYRVTGRPALFGLYHNINVTNRDYVALYVSRDFEEARAFAPNMEIAAFGWFSWRDLPADTAPSTRRRVAEVFEGAERSEHW
jgi:8-oxo-dGTP pyrophosphatase MutT (NUDIX family)